MSLICSAASLLSGDESNPLSRYSSKIEKSMARLDSIRQALSRGRKNLEKIREKEGTTLSQLTQVRENIKRTNVYIDALDTRLNALSASIDTLEDSLGIMKRVLDERQRQMQKRIVTMYKSRMHGIPPLLRLILTAESFTRMLTRVRYFQELLEYDAMLIETISQTRRKVHTQQQKLERSYERIARLKRAKKEEHDKLLAQKEEQIALLDEVRSKKEDYLARVKRLEKAKNTLNDLIAQLVVQRKKEKKRIAQSKKAAFEKQKGSLAWPLEGDIIKKFGKIVHPVYKTVTRNEGINIRSEPGEKVRSVAAGQVVHVGSILGLRNVVIVNHYSEYSTIYANLSRVFVQQGDELEYGAVLGTIRDATAVSEAQLHFEIRKNATALDPLTWLE